MQPKPGAGRAVSAAPYETAVWDWRQNIEVGVDYLAYCRSYLHRKTTFSCPRLLPAFHYGISYLEARDFDVRRAPVPDNEIYRALWRGNLAPGAATSLICAVAPRARPDQSPGPPAIALAAKCAERAELADQLCFRSAWPGRLSDWYQR